MSVWVVVMPAVTKEVQVIFLQSLAPLLELRPFIGKAEQSDCAASRREWNFARKGNPPPTAYTIQ